MPDNLLSEAMGAGYSVTFVGGGRRNCADMHSYGPGLRSIYILHYVLSGRGFLEADGRTYPVEAGETFLIYPGTVIHYYPDPAEPWEYTWVDFCGDEAGALLRHTGFMPKTPVSPALPREEMGQLYQRIQDSAGHTAWHRARADGCLQILLSYYMERFPSARQDDDGYGYVLGALQFITARFYRPLGVDDVASHLGISRTHLYRLFHRHQMVSPNEYIIRFRVENACAMLRDTALPVGHIARSVGFEDPLYFTKVFRRRTGMTPSAYRAEAKGPD